MIQMVTEYPYSATYVGKLQWQEYFCWNNASVADCIDL